MQQTLLIACLFVMCALPSSTTSSADQPLFVGTNEAQWGIFASTLDLTTGEFSPARAVGDAPHPGFLALHPQLPLLYAVTSEQHKPDGGVRAFQIMPDTWELNLTGKQPAGGAGSTHLEVHQSGAAIAVANYSGGSTSLLPLTSTGELQPFSALMQHQGSSVNADRQTKPYAHGVAFDTSRRFVCVADLGTDEVIVYRLVDSKQLEQISAWKAKPGAGPRHLAFHPGGRWLYCINELNSTLSVLVFDDEAGKLQELQTIGTLPPEFKQWNSTAEVVVHPNGRFVYGSNRGHDSTVVFAVDNNTGKLSLVEHKPTQGGHPRFIGIEPSGRYLIAANRDANNLVSFRIDAETGALQPTGHQVSIPHPICVVFPSLDKVGSH